MKTLVLFLLMQSPDSVTVHIDNIRKANEMFVELYYLRSKVGLLEINSKYDLQHISALEQREKACIELVQVYRKEPKKKLIFKWYHVALITLALVL